MAAYSPERTSALILAAGQGTRLGGKQKAFIEVGGSTLVERAVGSVRHFASQILIGVEAESIPLIREIVGTECEVIAGGATRQQTVQHLMARAENEIKLIHDVARPLATYSLFKAVVKTASRFGGAVPVLPATRRDSIALSDGEWLGAPLPRNKVVLVQTPYAFSRASITEAIRRAEDDGWQDTTITALLTRAGYRMRLVEGEMANVKITFPEDLAAIRKLFADTS
ncbi:MAG: IspD/TarI family cytidylyltransferase [Pseudomonadales bacterium]